MKVVSGNYRRPPFHPHPAPIDGVFAEWKAVTKDWKSAGTWLFGTSTGGSIGLLTTLQLKELGEPLPGVVFAGTPDY